MSTGQSSLLSDQSFENLGILPPIAQALYKAFPNVKRPTKAQAEFIPAILGEKDVLLKDATGTGKTFGTTLALLSKPRIRYRNPMTGEPSSRPSITSLMIVPHRDLAYQLLHWIQRMVIAGSTGTPPPINFIVQSLIRDATPLSQLLSNIRDVPPHVLIGTPQALLDSFKEDPEALQLETLSTVVVDEVDYLVESVPRKISQKEFEKARRKLSRHPSATKQLLDIIYADRIKTNEALRDKDWGGDLEVRSRKPVREVPSPQLIMSSATLRNHLKIHLYNESGWLKRDSLQKITGREAVLAEDLASVDRDALEGDEDVDVAQAIGGSGVEHSVLVVSNDGSVQNIPDAVESQIAKPQVSSAQVDDEPMENDSFSPSPGPEDLPPQPEYLTEAMVKKFSMTQSPFNPNALETVVTAFAMDVPSVALLVLPSTASVYRAVFELRMLGVNAHSLNLQDKDQGKKHLCEGSEEKDAPQENPTLLVSTVATTRGLDLPELSHLFILGNPEGLGFGGRVIDTYLHLAGRVGRFGRGGRVITVVEEREEDGEGKVLRDEPKMATRLLKELKLPIIRYELFD